MTDNFEKKLQALYRIDCPDAHDLGEYFLGLSPPQTASLMIDHLQQCPHCQAEIADLKTFFEETPAPQPAPQPIWTRIEAAIAQLLPMGATVVNVRGEQAGPRVYQTDAWQITIDVQADDAQGHKTVLGLIFGEGEAQQAELVQSGQLVTSAPVDELGNFVFTAVAAGTYELIFITDAAAVRIEKLDV